MYEFANYVLYLVYILHLDVIFFTHRRTRTLTLSGLDEYVIEVNAVESTDCLRLVGTSSPF